MKLHVRYRHVTFTRELEQLVTRRVHAALARFAHVIADVRVTLADVNGPRGGIDKTCRVEVAGPRLGSIVIAAAAAEVRVALDEAVGRVARTTARALHRRRPIGGLA